MEQIGTVLLKIILVFLQAYWIIIFANILLSWVVPPTNSIKLFLSFVTEPVIAPIRKLLAPLTAKSTIPLDLSPLVAGMIILMLQQVVMQLM